MFSKSLLLAAALCILAAPMAMAAGQSSPQPVVTSAGANNFGMCVKGDADSGQVLSWVKNEFQCEISSNGDIWVENGIVKKIYQRG